MKLNRTQRLILFSLGQFYRQLNQPLKEKPIKVHTSKIVFITFLLHSNIVAKQERTVYKNLESLENKKLIIYENRMITFTPLGLDIFNKIEKEIRQFVEIEDFFKTTKGPKRKLQTVIK